MAFSVRRSSIEDVATIRSQLMKDDEFILQKRYRNAGPSGSPNDPATLINISTLIETQYLCITVLQTTLGDDGEEEEGEGIIVGFAAFSDSPSTEATLIRNAHRWELLVDQCVSETTAAGVNKVLACETIWLNFFASSFGNGIDGARTGAFELESESFAEVIKTVFSTCPKVQRVAYALPAETPIFSPLAEYLSPIPEPESNKPRDFTGSIHSVRRDEHQEPLELRPGVVEDYDDFVPMLLDGAGVVTPLPSALYLEELLQDDNPYTAVIVAEDPVTHAAIGLMCIDASYEGQQHVTKQYATEPFNKLKALAVPQAPQFKLDVVAHASDVVSDSDPAPDAKVVKRERHAPKVAPYVPKKGGKQSNITQGQHTNHNSFHITLFYLYPEYESRAHQFIAYAFSLFKFAEYAYITLPHAAPEHPLLQHFSYVPIKRFQPTNAQGERLPLPEGLWLCCRYGMEQVQAHRYLPSDDENVGKLLKVQSELQASTVEAITVSLAQIGHETVASSSSGQPRDDENKGGVNHIFNNINKPLIASNAPVSPSGTYAVTLTWRKQPVGILVTRAVTIDELYALRRNFDIEKYVNMYPHGDRGFSSTNIYLEEDTAKTTHYRNDMPAHVVKFAFVKPVFRHWLRFLLREAMRLLPGCELLLHITQPQADIYNPLVNELIFSPPRRIVEKSTASITDNNHNGPASNNDDGQLTNKDQPGNQDVDGLICVYHTTRKALSDEKTKIHSRIVVAGASATGLAFIYNLITIPYLHFTNILLLSPDGLPAHPNHSENIWFADTMDWMEREYLLMQLPGRFRIAESHLVDFDRFDKYIYTVGGTCEPYDQLILTTGRQYSIPRELSVLHGAKNGVFPLSGSLNMAKVQQHVHESEIFEDALSSAVIYGHSLDIYCITSTIMRLGLSPHRTVVVLPEDTAVTGSLFMDPTVDLKLDRLLSGLGVKLLRGYTLERMEYDEDNNLSMVVVAPMSGVGASSSSDGGDGKVVEISASLFLYAHDKDIDSNVLSSLNKRSIVFDGRVIVENNYRTTDPNIYAAGPVAMFSLRFGPSRDFEEYSITEIGKHLAHTVLGFLGVDEFYNAILHDGQDKENAPKDDPLGAELGSSKTARAADGSLIQRERPKPLPRYVEPITKRVLLPGSYIYCITHSVAFPAYAAAEEHYNVMNSQANNGHSENQASIPPPICTHLTSSDDQGNTYVRVSINKNTKIIEAVIYFGDDPTVELTNLKSLVGLPSSVLNLMYNYDQHAAHNKGARLDILNFLRQPWSYVLFYDKFRELFDKIQTKFKDGTADASYIVERTRQDILEQELLPHNADSLPDEQTRVDYHNQLASETGEVRREVELELIKFLHEHKCFLPQRYFLPDITSHVAQPQ